MDAAADAFAVRQTSMNVPLRVAFTAVNTDRASRSDSKREWAVNSRHSRRDTFPSFRTNVRACNDLLFLSFFFSFRPFSLFILRSDSRARPFAIAKQRIINLLHLRDTPERDYEAK